MKQVFKNLKTKAGRINKKAAGFLAIALLMANASFAGSGVAGVGAGTSELAKYLAPVSSLILAIGAIVGLVGGVRVYIKWNSGDQDVNKEIMGWMGSCIFLVLVSVVIKAFFV
ncbi:MAG: DUF4134 domain-containing protein [Bacteroidota bacterium]